MAHSAHSTQPALPPHRATPRVEDNTPVDAPAPLKRSMLTPFLRAELRLGQRRGGAEAAETSAATTLGAGLPSGTDTRHGGLGSGCPPGTDAAATTTHGGLGSVWPPGTNTAAATRLGGLGLGWPPGTNAAAATTHGGLGSGWPPGTTIGVQPHPGAERLAPPESSAQLELWSVRDDDDLTAHARISLQAEVFNRALAVSEPLMEPWVLVGAAEKRAAEKVRGSNY